MTKAPADEFLALLGHELRNPLGAVRNAAHILRGRVGNDPQSLWALELIERQLDELLTVIETVSEVSRLRRGVAKTTSAPFAIGSAVDAAVAASAGLLAQKAQRCAVTLPAEDVQAEGDRKRTEQALRTLLRCASKALTTGATIAVGAAVAGDRFTIAVGAPDRPGIDVAPTPEVSVELILARGLAELLGGEVVVRAANSDDVRYELVLPLRAS